MKSQSSSPSTSTEPNTNELQLARLHGLLGIRAGKRQSRRGMWDLQPRIRRGLDMRAFDRVGEALGVSEPQLADLLHTTKRTIDRWRQHHKLMDESCSDRLFRIANVVAMAESIFENADKSRQWFARPNRSLRNERPADLLDTEVGSRHVEETLRRLQHGIFA